MGSIKFFASVLMIGLFAIAIITFATLVGDENDSAYKVGDDGEIQAINTSLRGEVTTWQSSINDSGSTFIDTTQDQGDQSATSGGQFKQGIGGALSMATSATRSGFEKIFGEDNSSNGFGIFLTGLTGILLFMLTAYAWKYWRGNPD